MGARLLFIGLWNFADDLGRIGLSAKSIKAQIFPSDDINSDTILGMIQELSNNGLLLLYTVNEKHYAQITGWQHQRIDKPQPGKHPAPTNGYSKNVPGIVATDTIGEDRKGKDKIDSEAKASGAVAPPDPSIAEREYFARGREVLGKGAGGQLANLLKAKGGNVALARSAIEAASQKQKPAEYVGAMIRSPTAKPLTEHQRQQNETRDILDAMDNFAGRRHESSSENLELLPDYSSERPEDVCRRLGQGSLGIPDGRH